MSIQPVGEEPELKRELIRLDFQAGQTLLGGCQVAHHLAYDPVLFCFRHCVALHSAMVLPPLLRLQPEHSS